MNSKGFTLIGLAVIIAIMGIVLATVAKVHSTIAKRDMEEELLFRGNKIKKAIDEYFKKGNTYPRNFDELLKDPRGVSPRKHLRKLYKDPVTSGEWDIIKDKAGRIVGVRSKSDKEPLLKGNFPEEYKTFEGKAKYSEWEFVSKPNAEIKPTSVNP
ncbi:MAG: type II secretion system protein [Deltaproteobacteria bacterium]|nr:type II secretion system protein [Deltaproteobacteria bacterium]